MKNLEKPKSLKVCHDSSLTLLIREKKMPYAQVGVNNCASLGLSPKLRGRFLAPSLGLRPDNSVTECSAHLDARFSIIIMKRAASDPFSGFLLAAALGIISGNPVARESATSQLGEHLRYSLLDELLAFAHGVCSPWHPFCHISCPQQHPQTMSSFQQSGYHSSSPRGIYHTWSHTSHILRLCRARMQPQFALSVSDLALVLNSNTTATAEALDDIRAQTTR